MPTAWVQIKNMTCKCQIHLESDREKQVIYKRSLIVSLFVNTGFESYLKETKCLTVGYRSLNINSLTNFVDYSRHTGRPA